MDEVITARLEKREINRLDRFVELGYFDSRSDAIRKIISSGLSNLLEEELKKGIVNELESPKTLKDQELENYGSMLFDKAVADIVREGRER
ncbi:MAG: ribbon-helix-helix domain-containing protein [Candidatus Hodarchaeales archaeon]|jgi:Arc/MetJ-type ribon-helix-helix transcriptional regulator